MLTLLACSDPPILCIDGSILGPDGCPGADTGDTDTSLLPAQEVFDAFDAFLTLGIPEARTPGTIFNEMLEHIDPQCPGQEGSIFALLKPCTTNDGYTFYGVSSWQSGTHDKGDFTEHVFGSLQTSLTATDPDGGTLVAGGIIQFGGWFYDNGDVNSTSWLAATVHYPPADSWLARSTSGDMQVNIDTTDEGSLMVLRGGYAIDGSAAYFDELVWLNECATGGVRTRDTLGRWYRLTLTDCSGCGEVVSGDHALGEVCVDLAPALRDLHTTLVAPP